MGSPLSPEALQSLLLPKLSATYGLHSRIHPLRSTLPQGSRARLWLKRDDELGNGLCGGKWRKWASLLPFLEKEQFDEIRLIASPHSNHLLAAVSLLRERGFPLHLFLLESHAERLQGNALFSDLLAQGCKRTLLSRAQWPKAEELAAQSKSEGRKIFLIPEGAALPEALPGALTLAADLEGNEIQAGIRIKHLFLDCGTGMTAIGALLGLQALGRSDIKVHITLIAGTEEEFRKRWAYFQKEAGRLLGQKLQADTTTVRFHLPVTAASFGAMNRTVLHETRRLAAEEGILMEPLYGIKHLLTAKNVIAEEGLNGEILLVNSGSPFGLASFQEMLQTA